MRIELSQNDKRGRICRITLAAALIAIYLPTVGYAQTTGANTITWQIYKDTQNGFEIPNPRNDLGQYVYGKSSDMIFGVEFYDQAVQPSEAPDIFVGDFKNSKHLSLAAWATQRPDSYQADKQVQYAQRETRTINGTKALVLTKPNDLDPQVVVILQRDDEIFTLAIYDAEQSQTILAGFKVYQASEKVIFKGKITSDHLGGPVLTGATIEVSPGIHTRTSKKDGSFSFSTLWPGTYEVWVSKTGYITYYSATLVLGQNGLTQSFYLRHDPNANKKIGSATYTNNQYGFQFSYPTWGDHPRVISAYPPTGALAMVQLEYRLSASGQYLESDLFVMSSNTTGLDLKNWLVSSSGGGLDDFVKNGNFKFQQTPGGGEAAMLQNNVPYPSTYDGPGGGIGSYLMSPDKKIIIGVGGAQDAYYYPDMNKLLSSFKFFKARG